MKQYSYEIISLFEELNSISDYEKMNPRHLGIDENFLNTEMQTS